MKKSGIFDKITRFFNLRGACGCNMSALGERSVRIREVEGSNPFRSTTKSCEISYFTAFLQLIEKICVDANRAFPADFGDFREY